MHINKCPFCESLNTMAKISTQSTNEFIIIPKDSSNSISNGLTVSLFGCNNCGAIILGSKDIINKDII